MMKNMKYMALAVVALCTGFTACTDGNDWEQDSAHNRTMAPKISSVQGLDGALKVTFTSYGGSSFLIEANEEPFDVADLQGDVKSSSITATVSGSPAEIKGLNGYTDYYVRMRAISDGKQQSNWVLYASSEIGEGAMTVTQKVVQTKGEQILLNVPDADRQESAITIRWTAGTRNPDKVTATYGAGSDKVVKSYDLSDADRANGYFTCTDLLSSTLYGIRIYEGQACIGFQEVKTLKAPPVSDHSITLTEDETEITQALLDQLADAAKASGKEHFAATIIIPVGKTAKFSNITGTATVFVPENMTLYFFGEESSDGNKGKIVFDNILDIKGYHGEISFDNLDISCVESTDNKYPINQSKNHTATVGNLTFTSCYIHDINCSLVRIQDGGGSIGTVTVDDCIIKQQGTKEKYAFIYDEEKTSGINEISITNSTFISCWGYIVRNKNFMTIKTATISNCTFYDCLLDGCHIFDSGNKEWGCKLTIEKIIIGKTHNAAAKGYRNVDNNTLDHVYLTASSQFGNDKFKSNDNKQYLDVREGIYTDTELFKDPANDDFTLLHWFDNQYDITFDIYGDPRWKADEPVEEETEE